MHVIEILLPLADNGGRRFPAEVWSRLREALVKQFGGLTAFTRSPAEGLWEAEEGESVQDDIVIFEVMADALDRDWWRAFRRELEQSFQQDEIVVRAREVERL